MSEQKFIHPSDLFETDEPQEPAWTCVRTRPRWEKRFSTWLRGDGIDHFLPVVRTRTRTYRKVQTTDVPLFPRYVFVQGTHPKQVFSRSGAVVYVLHPRSPREEREVHDTLTTVWRMLSQGQEVVPVQRLVPGEVVEVTVGALMGTRGRFVRKGAGGKIVVWMDLLGVGVAAELEDASMVQPVL